jgi:hypothetical protein
MFATGFMAWFHASAQNILPTPLPPLQVLESLEVRRGRDTTIYQRVVPPVLPRRSPAPALSAEEPQEPPLTAEQERRAAKHSAVVFLSATVYDHRVTELQWFENQRAYRAFSNADFNLLAGRSEIETEDTTYWLLMAVGNLAAEEVAAQNEQMAPQGLPPRQIPVAQNFSVTRAEYVLAEDSVTPFPSAETLAALDALHVFYDANKAALVEEQARRVAEDAARAEAERIKVAQPKRTVIRFWPADARQVEEMQARRNQR